MYMADLGMELWGASADTDPNENDNMSIDFDSFMQLLDEEPCHPEINLEDLSSSDLSLKYLFPGAGTSETIEPAVEKLEACSGNYCSIDDANKMVGAPESTTSKQIGMEVGISVTTEASVGSSIPHNSDGTFTDHMSSFTNCRSTSIHYNGCYQSFNLDKAIPGGVKDGVGTHLTVENAYLESYSGYHVSGTSTSSSFEDNGVANVTEPGSEYGFDDPFLSLGKIYSSSAKTEAKEQPFPRNSLNMSTFSKKKPLVKYEMHDLAVANSSNEAGIGINSRLAEHDCLRVFKEEKEIDVDRHSYVKGCHQNGTSMLPHVPALISEHGVREKDTRVGRAAAYNSYPHFKSICIEDKDHGTFVRPNVAATFPSNLSPESTQSNSIDCRYQVADDSDICIIEEMSHPAPSNRSILPGNFLIPPKPGSLYDSHHHFGREGSFKPRSEQIIFPDVSTLQDMSQQRPELDPPKGTLAVPLLRHQRIALAWMVQKESALNCSGGILADDQGLGKTVSTISLILKERSPSFKDRQENEKVHTLDLDGDDDSHDRMKSKVIKVDVDSLDASSGTATSSENSCSLAQRTGRPSGGTLVVCPTSVLRQWSDELHNKVSEQAKLSVIVYHGGGRTRDPFQLAKYDVVLTTYAIVSMEVPKQPLVDKSESGKHSASNNKRKWMEGKVAEATAGPLAKVGWFRVILDEAQSIKNHKTLVARACWGLRAKRRWCLSGTPIQNAIDDLYSYFRFLRYDPYDKYTTFCSRIKYPIQSSSSAGYQNLQAILKPVMLRRTKDTLLDGQPIINLPPKTVIMQTVEFSDEERDFYLQLEADSQAQFKEYAAAGKVTENYVNILLMLLRLRQACDHPLLVKGFDASSEWKQPIEMVKRLPPEKQRHLLNCLEASLAICTICHDPPEGAVVSICGHVFCNQCISEQMTGDERECPAKDCKAKLSRSSMFPRAALDTSPSSTLGNTCDANEPPSATSLYSSSKIRAALNALQLLTKPPQNSLNSPDESNRPNGKKLEVAIKPDKAILFSQWTKMLDLIEAGLKSYGIQYRRLDGTMSVAARDKAVKEFNALPEVTVMIMSLKAASLGLNMVAANHVLMMDLWWNPTTEDQAIDRAHRIGQTRPVTVLRLTVNDTVEDRILELQRKKREMVESAFGEDQSGNRESRLTVEDLNYLFRV